MSLSLAISNALTGLNASSRQADLISNNVANALTPGYARRDIELGSAAIDGAGAGVRVDGVGRATSSFATATRRLADAAEGGARTLSDASQRLADVIGDPGAPGSLSTAADRLETALSAAGDTPESPALLSAAVGAAANFSTSVNRIAVEAMSLRTEADASIASQVATINSSLTKIQSINAEIKARSIGGGDISALEDQRDRLIESISSMIPLRIVPRPFDEVALYAKNGGQLLDGKAFELEFTPTRAFGPDQTLANGALSGITIEGRDIPIGALDGGGLLDGGSLSAAFQLRDAIIPEISADLDAFAADLVQRTEGLAADPTLAPGDPGLFTDAGAAYDPANETGLALRLSLNAAVDPSQGGELFRLRDGLSAATAGEEGESSLLRGLQEAITAPVAAPVGANFSGARSAAGFAVELSSAVLAEAASAESRSAFESGRATALAEAEIADIGVDTDQELSRLLLVEQSYAANARVIQVVDDLLERLLSI